jgi:bifunctional UDP-N-acetylglucosamine pyrophosphorylase/glucosamine-1-phosphate N-acetyltransferase
MSDNGLACIILAGGKSTRMKSETPKVLHKVAGLSLIGWLLRSVESLNPEKVVVVTAPFSDDAIAAEVAPHETVIQKTAKGTGDAVKAALPALKGFKGQVLILLGDMPLLRAESIADLIGMAHGADAGMAVLAADAPDPSGYGRLVTHADGSLTRITEDKDCTDAEREITLINTGAFCVSGAHLDAWVNRIDNKNAQGEFYITDLPEIAAKDGKKTFISVLEDEDEALGVNDRLDLSQIEYLMQIGLRLHAMEGGATLIDPQSVFFSFDTKIGQDVLIEPNVIFGTGVEVEDGAKILAFSHLEGAKIGKGASVGPYARIRPKSIIESGASVGNFIEVNRSTLKSGSKAKHLGYLGDVTVGAKCNVGAGTVVANYDGYEKHKSSFGKNSFIGSNSTIVAPVTVGEGAIVAAGSTVTVNVPDDALAIARVEGDVRPGWALERRKKKES